MGNCTSKKSRKSLKLSAVKKPQFQNKMDQEQDTHTKRLSKKVAPFTKGEVTSFGFKKKLTSQLPVPITLTSNGHPFHEANDKVVQNGTGKVLSDGYQSGSSVESLCHAPFRSTPKMVRKSRDLMKQAVPASSESNPKNVKTAVPATLPLRNESSNGNLAKSLEPNVNRFGFRQPTPPRATHNPGKILKNGGANISRAAFITGQEPYETGPHSGSRQFEVSSRSRSEGPREAFFRQNIHSTNSIQSGLNQSKVSLTGNPLPGKFTLQTSQLPRPQFPVRMTDPKTAKTAANYHRKGGGRNDSNPSMNEDSGFESHPSANNTLERHIEVLESSPGSKVRRRLPACKGKKLEMKIVGNKFELLKKDEDGSGGSPDVVTEISLIKLPNSSMRNGTAVINTGLVEQRTNQYLKKISQPFKGKDFDVGGNDPNKRPPKSNSKITVDSNNRDEGLGAESEEEKLFKDSKKSEKTFLKYSMSDGCGDAEDMLPGETMAEDVSLCLSFEEETSSGCTKNLTERPTFLSSDVTPNTIRLDALKLSKELKYKNNAAGTNRKGEEPAQEFLAVCEKDEDTFPSDSILEQLSDSDSLGDKGENKNNDKEKNIKVANMNLDREDLGIEMDEGDNSKSDTDVDENDLELNADESEMKDENKNCLETASPDSPGTPTHASNSLSLSDGRDFLIDDEIADQPQLCLSESYVDCSCKEEGKTCNERTVTVNNEFVTCCDVQTNTVATGDEVEKQNENEEVEIPVLESVDTVMAKGQRRRLNSGGTLSPCESITSDDLMLDFETNSLEETAGRFDVNENISVENLDISTSREEIRDGSSQRLNVGSGDEKSPKAKERNSNCSTPASTRSSEMGSGVVRSPLRSSRSTPADDESIKLDKISYQNMFQDIIGIKAMLLKLKRLLSESEGGLQENGRIYPDGGTLGNIMEDELTDLRRQVLFLQQQLEEREKMVQVLRLKISQTSDPGTAATDPRKQSNAATQTGWDQFQQDFPHFRVFQTTPVV